MTAVPGPGLLPLGYSKTGNVLALTDAATITGLDTSLADIFTVTLAGNRTLSLPTNGRIGAWCMVKVVQDATGNRTLAYASGWLFPGGAPTASTGANAIDWIIAFFDGTSWNGVMTKAYA